MSKPLSVVTRGCVVAVDVPMASGFLGFGPPSLRAVASSMGPPSLRAVASSLGPPSLRDVASSLGPPSLRAVASPAELGPHNARFYYGIVLENG